MGIKSSESIAGGQKGTRIDANRVSPSISIVRRGMPLAGLMFGLGWKCCFGAVLAVAFASWRAQFSVSQSWLVISLEPVRLGPPVGLAALSVGSGLCCFRPTCQPPPHAVVWQSGVEMAGRVRHISNDAGLPIMHLHSTLVWRLLFRLSAGLFEGFRPSPTLDAETPFLCV